jgi:PKD domain
MGKGWLVAALALAAGAVPGTAVGAAWLPLQSISVPDSDATSRPAVALDPAQDVFAVWQRGANVDAAVRPAGGSFAVTPLSPAGTAATEPDVTADAAGDAIVVWVENNAVHGALRPAGGAFASLGTLSSAGGERPRIAFASDGTAVLVYALANTWYGRARPPGGAFGPETPLYGPVVGETPALIEPAIATDQRGNAMIVFGTDAFSGMTSSVFLRAVLHTANGFGPPQLIWQDAVTSDMTTSRSITLAEPAVAMDAAGNAAAAVTQRVVETSMFLTFVTSDLRAAIRPVEFGSWSTPAQSVDSSVSLFPGTELASARLAYAATGEPVLVWSKGALGGAGTVRAAGGSGTTFGAPADVGTGALFQALGLAPLTGGQTLALFGNVNAVDYALRPAGGRFAAPAEASGGNQPAASMAVASDPAGDAVAMWLRSDTSVGHARAQAQIYDATPPALALTAAATGNPGKAVALHAAATDAFSPVSVSWAFGDGGSATGADVTHAFSRAGTFSATATATDGAGNAATASRSITVGVARPVVLSFTADPKRFAVAKGTTAVSARVHRGTTLRYRLSEAGKVRISFARVLAGRRSGKRCLRPTARLRHKARCSRYGKATAITRTARAGANATRFTGHVRGKPPLKPGTYRATIVETATGAPKPSTSRSLRFTIVPAR